MLNMHYIRLNNNVFMPIIGHGMGGRRKASEQPRKEKGILLALKHGHRLIDTAKYYNQDTVIANALKKMNIKRKDVFITSKVWPDIIGNEQKMDEWVKKSLYDLNTDYFDQLLLHFPLDNRLNIKGWKVLEKYYQKGITKTIGISNYEIYELRHLLNHCTYKPQVNQIEASLMYLNFQLLHECIINDIQCVAFSPFGDFRLSEEQEEELMIEANNLSMTKCQIMLAYLLGKGFIVITQSNSEEHIKENLNVLKRQNDFFLAARALAKLQQVTRTRLNPDANAWSKRKSSENRS